MMTGDQSLFAIDASDVASPKGQPPSARPLLEHAAFPSLARASSGRLRMAYVQSHFDTGIWRFDLTNRSGGKTVAEPKTSPFIVSTQAEYLPQYSPDDQKVAFVSHTSGAAEIWVCDKDASNPMQLTSGGWPETALPRWSPDGAFISFQARSGGHGDIFTIPAGGGVPKLLTSGLADEWGSSWSPDGHWIYFGSNRSGRFEIWKAPSAGGAAIQVTRNGGIGPFVSPDGHDVYFTRAQELWRIGVENGTESRVLPSLSDWSRAVATKNGIYFIPAAAQPYGTAGQFVLNFMDFSNGNVQTIVRLDRPPFIGMTVSADERWLLLTQIDQVGADLMLVDRFR
jgi:Tol biopolymer transport system component